MIEEIHVPDVWMVPVAEVIAHWNPFEAWCDHAITMDEVRTAVAEGRLDGRPFDIVPLGTLQGPAERAYHVARIAHLVVHRDPEPLSIDVGCPDLGWHPRDGAFDFIDGNHRLCAALVRGDDEIAVGYGGDVDAMADIFPGGRSLTRPKEAA